MKIARIAAYVLRVPFNFPLIKETQHALGTFVEIETDGGRVEFHYGGWQLGMILFDGAPPPVKGWVTLPEAPGLGFTPKAGILDLAVN